MGDTFGNHRPPREIVARGLIIVALVALGFGTIGGSSPSIPNPVVYAIAAWVTAGLWTAATILSHDRGLKQLADAALLVIACMRGFGYFVDLIDTGRSAFLAALAAWLIVAGLAARPLRLHGS